MAHHGVIRINVKVFLVIHAGVCPFLTLGFSLSLAHFLLVAPPSLCWLGFLKETLHQWTPERTALRNNGALEFRVLILHVMISRLNTILLLARAS